jgi:hypothetical protein
MRSERVGGGDIDVDGGEATVAETFLAIFGEDGASVAAATAIGDAGVGVVVIGSDDGGVAGDAGGVCMRAINGDPFDSDEP